MAIEELSCIPERITAGDTVKVRLSWTQYPASAWGLAAVFNGPSSFQGSITTDGDAFLLTIPAANTKDKPIGKYAWALRVTESATQETAIPATGVVLLSPDPFTVQAPTAAAALVATLEAAVQMLASKTVQSASVNGKSFTLLDIEKLNNMLRLARADLQSEIDDAAVIAGRSRSSLIRIRA